MSCIIMPSLQCSDLLITGVSSFSAVKITDNVFNWAWNLYVPQFLCESTSMRCAWLGFQLGLLTLTLLDLCPLFHHIACYNHTAWQTQQVFLSGHVSQVSHVMPLSHMSDARTSHFTCQIPRHLILHVRCQDNPYHMSCQMPDVTWHVIRHAMDMQTSDQYTSQATTLYYNLTKPKTRRQVFRDRYAMSS
jgi:hypothetical protein